jgi:hypothetical protein
MSFARRLLQGLAVRLRTDVPNGAGGAGVHQGGNPQPRAAALLEVDQFLARFTQ